MGRVWATHPASLPHVWSDSRRVSSSAPAPSPWLELVHTPEQRDQQPRGAAGLSRRPGLGRRASLAAVSWPLPPGVNVHSSGAAGSRGLGRTSRLRPLRASDSSLSDAPRVGHPQTSGPREDPGMAHIPLPLPPSHRGLRPESPWVLSSRGSRAVGGETWPTGLCLCLTVVWGLSSAAWARAGAGCGCCRIVPRPPTGQVPIVACSVQGPLPPLPPVAWLQALCPGGTLRPRPAPLPASVSWGARAREGGVQRLRSWDVGGEGRAGARGREGFCAGLGPVGAACSCVGNLPGVQGPPCPGVYSLAALPGPTAQVRLT